MTDTPTEREEGGAWAKLRRRKVVRWGIACVAGAALAARPKDAPLDVQPLTERSS